MRDGAVVLSGETAAYRDEQLINAMTPVSRDHALSDTQKLWLSLPGNRRTQPQDFPVLRVEDLTGEGFIDLNLEIRAGEIVGLAGLVGSGRTEFAETLYGLRPPRAGRIWLENREISRDSTRAVGQRAGLSAGRPSGLGAVSRCASALEHGDVQSAVVVAAGETGGGGG